MSDLKDAPLAFHPSRQFRGALFSRSNYFQLSHVEDEGQQGRAIGLDS